MSGSVFDYEKYLEQARIPIRLACRTKSGWPVVLSLWYLYRNGEFFCATKKNAQVVSYLKSSRKCAYEIAADRPPYCGVRGQATARLDDDLGPQILDELILRYLGGKENPLADNLLKNRQNETAIVLKPVNIFSWNFSNRMEKVTADMMGLIEQICPE